MPNAITTRRRRLRALRAHAWWIGVCALAGFAAGWGLTGGSVAGGVIGAVAKGALWTGVVFFAAREEAEDRPAKRRLPRPSPPVPRSRWVTGRLRRSRR
ncbi:hypothetical protein HNR73_003016 [Phytomonospora endophytica]|uniref:Uncharacterized protein n=1 Tax=Phytomonospora endophytica TaxID=714109 RepID=A0A841FRI5_9ACTN|nr:hypothetical protein [Phytomonospora endophytica]